MDRTFISSRFTLDRISLTAISARSPISRFFCPQGSHPPGCVSTPDRLRRESCARCPPHRLVIQPLGPARLRVFRPFCQVVGGPLERRSMLLPDSNLLATLLTQPTLRRTLLFGSYESLSKDLDDMMSRNCVLRGALDRCEPLFVIGVYSDLVRASPLLFGLCFV